jgi:hypothetical protein
MYVATAIESLMKINQDVVVCLAFSHITVAYWPSDNLPTTSPRNRIPAKVITDMYDLTWSNIETRVVSDASRYQARDGFEATS